LSDVAHRITRLGKINFVVADLDESISFWRDIFGAKELRRRGNTTIGKTGENQAEFGGANIDLGGLVVDLAQPNTEHGALGQILATRGEGFLSICLEVEDFWDSVDWFESHGLPVGNMVEMMDNKVGFISPEKCHGILVEIIQRPWWWTWDDSELTNDALQEIGQLVQDGKGYPQPLEHSGPEPTNGHAATADAKG
jgi:catechol 2,3-dioxygenase-like lactoylglutathione lyase family enzyme